MIILILSILASVAIWTYLFNLNLAVILIASVLIHEYGHFYWMGREGIKNKDMFFMPPFGAVARAKDPWTSHGAELRIALAGPIAGLLSVLLFYVLWLIFGGDIFLASIGIACIINLFNIVVPIAVLDGGRVVKSILYSIHQRLGDGFYIFGFIFLGIVFIRGFFNPVFILFIGYLLYSEWSRLLESRNVLENMKEVKKIMRSNPSVYKRSEEDLSILQKDIDHLDSLVNMKKMTWVEIIIGFLLFVKVTFTYIVISYWVSGRIDFFDLQKYF